MKQAVSPDSALMLQLARETTSSIELTLNAKHEYQFIAKVYFDAAEENGYESALRTLEEINRRLRAKYIP